MCVSVPNQIYLLYLCQKRSAMLTYHPLGGVCNWQTRTVSLFRQHWPIDTSHPTCSNSIHLGHLRFSGPLGFAIQNLAHWAPGFKLRFGYKNQILLVITFLCFFFVSSTLFFFHRHYFGYDDDERINERTNGNSSFLPYWSPFFVPWLTFCLLHSSFFFSTLDQLRR
jgi:hypothetical protein